MGIEQTFQQALQDSPALAFLMVYLAGIATSFTPCVLPVLPMAVGTITTSAQVVRETPDGTVRELRMGRALLMGLVYAAGLASMFAGLGILAALSGKAVFGMLASSPVTYLVMAVVVFGLGLWLIIGNRVDPGAFLQNRALKSQGSGGPLIRIVHWYMMTPGGGIVTTFSFGAVSGLIAGPCTAPVIALVLGYVAKQGAVSYGAALMFVFGLGLATLMVVAGMSVGLARSLSRQGNLAKGIKYAMAGLMFAMSGYFLYVAGDNFGLWAEEGAATRAAIYKVSQVPEGGVPAEKALEIGQTLPDFSWTDGTRTEKLSDFKGKVVFFTFFGEWCHECKKEIPHLRKMEKITRDNPRIKMLAIDVMDPEVKARSFIASEQLPYDVILDLDSDLIDRLEATAFPWNMILGPDGKTAYSSRDFPMDYEKRFEELLK